MERTWNLLLIYCIALVVTALMVWGVYAIIRPVKVSRYYLSGSMIGRPPYIQVVIENAPDETIMLDRTTTYGDAIRMVDSLNKTLHD